MLMVNNLKFSVFVQYHTNILFLGIQTTNLVELLPNPIPGTVISSVSRVTAGGNVFINNGTLSEDQKRKLESTFEAQDKYWSQWTKNFLGNLRASFPPGFPFN